MAGYYRGSCPKSPAQIIASYQQQTHETPAQMNPINHEDSRIQNAKGKDKGGVRENRDGAGY